MATKCFVCQKFKIQGVTLLDSYFCLDCEQLVVEIHPNHPRYWMVIHRMKMLLKNEPRIVMM